MRLRPSAAGFFLRKTLQFDGPPVAVGQCGTRPRLWRSTRDAEDPDSRPKETHRRTRAAASSKNRQGGFDEKFKPHVLVHARPPINQGGRGRPRPPRPPRLAPVFRRHTTRAAANISIATASALPEESQILIPGIIKGIFSTPRRGPPIRSSQPRRRSIQPGHGVRRAFRPCASGAGNSVGRQQNRAVPAPRVPNQNGNPQPPAHGEQHDAPATSGRSCPTPRPRTCPRQTPRTGSSPRQQETRPPPRGAAREAQWEGHAKPAVNFPRRAHRPGLAEAETRTSRARAMLCPEMQHLADLVMAREQQDGGQAVHTRPAAAPPANGLPETAGEWTAPGSRRGRRLRRDRGRPAPTAAPGRAGATGDHRVPRRCFRQVNRGSRSWRSRPA